MAACALAAHPSRRGQEAAPQDEGRGADAQGEHGAGEVLLRDLMDEAAAAGKDVVILVEKHNPAMRLCRGLGFAAEEDKGVYDLMRWTAQPSS